MAVSGLGVAMAVSGVVLMLSGVRNRTVKDTLTGLLSGQVPQANPTGPVTVGLADASSASPAGSTGTSAAGDTSAHSASAKSSQALAASMAFASGHVTWITGQQWQDWLSLWNQESGWNNLAQNPESGAFGIAQALGHGTATSAGKYGNQYPSVAANDGDAASQIAWGIGYIASTYGSPSAAWAHEVANNWY